MIARTKYSGDISSQLLELRVDDDFDREVIRMASEAPVDRYKDVSGAKDLLDRSFDIIIHGDYDADGICATAISRLYMPYAKWYIPERIDGYGVSREWIETLGSDTTVFTVDCGIASAAEIEEAAHRNIHFIVTDHHDIPTVIPGTFVFNPKIFNSSHELCGAYTAYQVLKRMYGDRDGAMQLAAIGTICDVMPMLGENRYVVREGLKQIRSNPILGIYALCKKLGVNTATITEKDIGWTVGPAINSCGRMGNADIAARLMMTTDEDEAMDLAKEVVSLSKQRKQMTGRVSSLDLTSVTSSGITDVYELSIEYSGSIGLAANKLATQSKAAIVICKTNGDFKCSVRAPDWYDCGLLVNDLRPILDGGGGHKGAAGFSFQAERFNEFIAKVESHYQEPSVESTQRYDADIEIDAAEAASILWEIEELAPFGRGFEEPEFVSTVEVTEAKVIGSNKDHLKMLCDGVPAVAFGMGDMLEQANGNLMDIVYTVQMNHFAGSSNPQLIVRKMKPA